MSRLRNTAPKNIVSRMLGRNTWVPAAVKALRSISATTRGLRTAIVTFVGRTVRSATPMFPATDPVLAVKGGRGFTSMKPVAGDC